MKITKEQIKRWKNLLPIEWRIQLNSGLIEKQDLGIEEVARIFAAHGKRLYLFNRARKLLIKAAHKGKLTKKIQEEMYDLNDTLEQAEYQAQEGWKFKRDSNYHNWWLDLPGCECPKIDNEDLRGSGMRITNENCPWHSLIYQKKKMK
jgi:hypothetical protein